MRAPCREPRRAGVTLLELSLVLGIIGVLLAVTVPRFAEYVDRIRVAGATREIVSTFATARQIAIARARHASVLVHADRGTIEVRCESQRVLERDLAAAYGVTLRATRDSMAYDPIGLGYGAANLRVIVARGAARDTVVISRLGRIRHN